MADQHFEICRQLLRRRRYDFFMTVDMGVDRIHHALWKLMDPRHPLFVPDHPLANAIHDYYVYVDGEIASLLELAPPDAIVLVVSDHGGQAMQGGMCVNEWLAESGQLTAVEYPPTPRPLAEVPIDWAETRAWGDGGYYGRVFLNVAGREPSGRVPAADYESARAQLARELEALAPGDAIPLATRAFRPEELYREVKNVAPDLIVYFGDLTYRSVGSLGHRSQWTLENDTGPDDANHAQHGIFVFNDPRVSDGGRRLGDVSIYDVAPTLLTLLGLEPPEGVRGRPIPDLVD
jgi:predicted AlkP superfamily phosphohydrolase/phosphomutase